MQDKKKQQTSHADHVVRRMFIKKAAIGAAFAVPAIESLTKSDILVKSALASTVPSWTITASVDPTSNGSGTALPTTQTVPNGGSAIVTVTLGSESTWMSYSIDGNPPINVTGAAMSSGGTIPFVNVTANHHVVVKFGIT